MLPHPADTVARNLDALEAQLLLDSQRPWQGSAKGVIEHGLLDLAHPGSGVPPWCREAV
jgi:hypothetical protein